MTNGVPFWQVRFVVPCAICAVPVCHEHQLNGEVVCTSCYLHDQGRGEIDGIAFALEFMRDRNICAYCGEYGRLEESLPAGDSDDGVWDVHQCEECRELTRGQVFPTFEAKRLKVKHALAKRYGVSAADLRTWNKMESDVVKIGQTALRFDKG